MTVDTRSFVHQTPVSMGEHQLSGLTTPSFIQIRSRGDCSRRHILTAQIQVHSPTPVEDLKPLTCSSSKCAYGGELCCLSCNSVDLCRSVCPEAERITSQAHQGCPCLVAKVVIHTHQGGTIGNLSALSPLSALCKKPECVTFPEKEAENGLSTSADRVNSADKTRIAPPSGVCISKEESQ